MKLLCFSGYIQSGNDHSDCVISVVSMAPLAHGGSGRQPRSRAQEFLGCSDCCAPPLSSSKMDEQARRCFFFLFRTIPSPLHLWGRTGRGKLGDRRHKYERHHGHLPCAAIHAQAPGWRPATRSALWSQLRAANLTARTRTHEGAGRRSRGASSAQCAGVYAALVAQPDCSLGDGDRAAGL